jgi:hypothetical protein
VSCYRRCVVWRHYAQLRLNRLLCQRTSDTRCDAPRRIDSIVPHGIPRSPSSVNAGTTRVVTLGTGLQAFLTMPQAVSSRALTAQARVCTWVSLCRICGGQSGTGTEFSPSSSVFRCQFNHPWLCIFIYHLGYEKYSCWWPQFRDRVSHRSKWRVHNPEHHRICCIWNLVTASRRYASQSSASAWQYSASSHPEPYLWYVWILRSASGRYSYISKRSAPITSIVSYDVPRHVFASFVIFCRRREARRPVSGVVCYDVLGKVKVR